MPIKVISYECQYCENQESNEKLCLEHENICAHNPAQKTCLSCTFQSYSLMRGGYGLYCSKRKSNCASHGEWEHPNCELWENEHD